MSRLSGTAGSVRSVTKPRVVLPGVLVGLLLLGLAVVFAVVLPKAQRDGRSRLPDKLPGGYIAADTSEAYAALTNTTDADKQNYADQQVASNKFAAKSSRASTSRVSRATTSPRTARASSPSS